MNVSSSANSLADSRISRPPRVTSRRRWVETQVADLQHAQPLRFASPSQRSQAGEQLGEGEWLDEVIVGAGVEPGHAVLHRVAGGQHQHRRPDAVVAQPPARLEAVDPGQHHVEHDRVVLVRLRHPEGVLAGGRDVCGETLGDEPATNEARHPELVLDHENSHRR